MTPRRKGAGGERGEYLKKSQAGSGGGGGGWQAGGGGQRPGGNEGVLKTQGIENGVTESRIKRKG